MRSFIADNPARKEGLISEKLLAALLELPMQSNSEDNGPNPLKAV
jgi:hypothetical protein